MTLLSRKLVRSLGLFSRRFHVRHTACRFGRQASICGDSCPAADSPLKRISAFSIRQFQSSSALWGEIKIVNVPPFAESVTEGDLRWEKNVGDSVSEDEVVCEIETDKTSVPVPSPAAGVIVERFAEDGATVKPGQKLFSLEVGAGGGAAPKPKAEPKAAPPPAKEAAAPAAAAPPPSPPPSQQPLAAAPRPPPPQAPVSVTPTSQMRAVPAPSAMAGATIKVPPQDPTKEISGTRTEYRVKMNRMRQRIAERLKNAQNTYAMLTTFNEIDMSHIMEFRKANQEAFQKKHGIKLGFMSAFVRAAAYALQDQPVVNAVIVDNEIVYRDYIDVSVAVATPKGLVVPVLRNVETMNYAEIEKSIAALGEKARLNKLAIEDMDGGTFTISNGGVFGSLMGTPIINPPQSSILGMHATFDRPVAIKGQVLIRPMMYIALTYDHRLIDGREAVLFLRKIKAAVEDPRIIVAGL